MKLSILFIAIFPLLYPVVSAEAQDGKKTRQEGKVIRVTDENYEEETSRGLVVAEFYAHWCGACMTMNPILGRMAKEYNGQLKIVKINSDLSRQLTQKMNVNRLPTILIYKDGEVKHRLVGGLSQDELEKILKPYLPTPPARSKRK